MTSSASTFATLRALQLVIADALDDIQRVFAQLDRPISPSSPSTSLLYAASPDLSPATSPFPTTPPASFPPTPLSAAFPSTIRSPTHTDSGVPLVDYPSPDSPIVPNSPNEQLAIHPDAAAAASRIVAACGQMSNIVHKPFSSLCDAIMSYNLPACMRLVEHLHVVEIIRQGEENRRRDLNSGRGAALPASETKMENLEASGPISTTPTRDTFDVEPQTSTAKTEPMPGACTHKVSDGLHVVVITNVIHSYMGKHYVDPSDLVHALRLLSTHHIFRETAPDTFALTRVASLLDSGKSVEAVFLNPESKYDDGGALSAFVALGTDELFKSAAYLTEAFTGVQLPRLSSTLNPSCASDAILPGTDTIPSTSSFVINDPVPCAPTTRSSSVLTHIVYPEDEVIQFSSRSLTEPPERDALCSPAKEVDSSSEPLVTGPLLPAPLDLTEASKQIEKEGLRSANAITCKLDKLPAFNLAFRTDAPFFEWLENGGKDPLGGTGEGACVRGLTRTKSVRHGGMVLDSAANPVPQNSFRLDRFSKAMMGTTLWEAPKAILSGFDWYSLPKGSTIIDIGGGIGSTTMILARALNEPRADSVKKQDSAHNEEPQPTPVVLPSHRSKVPSDSSFNLGDEPQNTPTTDGVSLRFVIQDKPVVTALGMEAWRSKCPEMLEIGQVVFQSHDFFEPQPPLEPPHLSRQPAVYLLRVVLHDWPDECARRILINLRVASNPETRLVIAEHVLPLACVDGDVDHVKPEAREGSSTEEWTLNSVLANVEGAERTLVPPPLLSNLGKASANAYWMDLLMHITFNGKERTLREFCALALSAGWRVTRMTRPEGTLFAYLVCEPITLPDDAQAIHNAVVLSSELSTVVVVPSDEPMHHSRLEPSRQKRLPPRPVSLLPSPILERSSSRCGTPTFGSRMLLPKDEELQGPRTRGAGVAKKWLKSKGLGVRGVMMQKAEKQKEEQNSAKGGSARDDNDQNAGRTSSPHMRVWWKKSPPNSSSNSSIAVQELSGEVPEHRQNATGRAQRGTLKSSGILSTPSPRISPVHQKWPSTESTAMLSAEPSPPVTRARRPSVASITRKLSFATFGRRPSIADITEPLPTPPHSATLTELAPPPALRGDTGRSLKHLPSLPTLGRSGIATSTAQVQPAIPRRPSFSFVSEVPPLPQVVRPTLPRRPDAPDSSKLSILKSRMSPHASKRSSPDQGQSASFPQRQRRVTLSNSPCTPSRALAEVASGVSVPAELAGPEVKRMPSMPKLPRRLSIPMLRRKQGQSVVQGGENEG